MVMYRSVQQLDLTNDNVIFQLQEILHELRLLMKQMFLHRMLIHDQPRRIYLKQNIKINIEWIPNYLFRQQLKDLLMNSVYHPMSNDDNCTVHRYPNKAHVQSHLYPLQMPMIIQKLYFKQKKLQSTLFTIAYVRHSDIFVYIVTRSLTGTYL